MYRNNRGDCATKLQSLIFLRRQLVLRKEESGKVPGKNHPQNLLQPADALDILSSYSGYKLSRAAVIEYFIKYWFFITVNPTWKLCHLAGC